MYEYKGKIINVVDGDTVDAIIDLGFDIMHKIRIRLADINAPETRTKDLVEKAAGIIARDWLKEQVLDKEVVFRTEVDGHKGKYGRYIAKIYIHTSEYVINNVDIHDTEVQYRSINERMLDLGLAVPYGEKWVSNAEVDSE